LPNFVQIVNPTIKRGIPPRDLTMADIITVPVKRPGTWNLGDMLSHDSVVALWRAHTAAEKRTSKA